VCSVAGLTLCGAALAQDAGVDLGQQQDHNAKIKKAIPHKKSAQVAHIKTKYTATAMPTVSTTSVAAKPTSAERAAALDKVYAVKSWDIRFPSYGDTLTQDYGGYRTALAKLGFGIEELNVNYIERNALNTPTRVPSSYPACTGPLPSVCSVLAKGRVMSTRTSYF
jgi:hypothetical protein